MKSSFFFSAGLLGMKRVRGRGCGIYIIWEEGGGWRRRELLGKRGGFSAAVCVQCNKSSKIQRVRSLTDLVQMRPLPLLFYLLMNIHFDKCHEL